MIYHPLQKHHIIIEEMGVIFKNPSWLRKVSEIVGFRGITPSLMLVGYDLPDVLEDRLSGRTLMLLVNDWSGDHYYERDLFLPSLQPHDIDDIKDINPSNSMITLASGLRLFVQDAIFSEEWLSTPEITKFLSREKDNYVFTEKEGICQKIPIEHIQGLQEFKGDQAIKDICSVKLKMNDGMMRYRVIFNPEKKVRVVGEMHWEPGCHDGPATWRLAKENEGPRRGSTFVSQESVDRVKQSILRNMPN